MTRGPIALIVVSIAVSACLANLAAAPPADQPLPDLFHVKDNNPRGSELVSYPPNVLEAGLTVMTVSLPLNPKDPYGLQVFALSRVPKDDPRRVGLGMFSAHYPSLRDDDVFPLMGEFFRVVRHVGQSEFDIAKCRAEQSPPCQPLRKDTLLMPLPGFLDSHFINLSTKGDRWHKDYHEWKKGLVSESPPTYRLGLFFRPTNQGTKIPGRQIEAKQDTRIDLPNCQLEVRQIVLPNPAKQHHGFIEFNVLNPVLAPNRWDDLYEEFAAKLNAVKTIE